MNGRGAPDSNELVAVHGAKRVETVVEHLIHELIGATPSPAFVDRVCSYGTVAVHTGIDWHALTPLGQRIVADEVVRAVGNRDRV
jgi:hypothetical protein